MNAVVRMFGPLEIERDGRRVGPRDLGGPKPRQVLEILLCDRGRLVPKDRIAELLWGEALPQNAAATLETYVSNLRKHLEPDVDDAERLVVTEPGGYRFAVERAEVDLDRFDRLSTRQDRKSLEEALRLARGEVLEDEPYGTWAVQLRERYREQHLRTLVSAAQAALVDGDPVTASAHAEAAVDLDPLREQAYQVLMVACYLRGSQDEALRAFERARVALAEELGVDPMPRTVALHVGILRHEDPWRLWSAPEAARTSLRGAAPVELPLLGRVEELAGLQAAAEHALAGAGGVLLIAGEAGIGKSRLVDELAGRLRVPVGRAKCFPLDRGLPFVPLAVAVRELLPTSATLAARLPALGEILPELGHSGLPPEAARTHALEALATVLAERAPLALILDDLQWADASTVAALAYLARRGPGPVLVVGAFRSEETPPDDPLWQLPATLRIELGLLEPGDLAPLALTDLHPATGGHPLFVAERLRALAEGHTERLPDNLRETIVARCRAAGPRAHRLLAVASILGREFTPGMLGDTLGADVLDVVEELELLCDRRLLRPTAVGFDFRHDLIREALQTSVSPARRRILHGRALESLERTKAPPGELAHHAEHAGAFQRAVRYALAAGDQARASWANVEAAGHYERARRIVGSHPDVLEPAAHISLLVRLAHVLATLGRPDEATGAAEEARDRAAARGDDRSLFDALEALATVRHRGASAPSEALPHARRGLEVAQRLADNKLLVRARVLVANPHVSLGQLDEAMTHYQAALDLAVRAEQLPAAFPLARVGLIHHLQAREREAIGWCERAEARAFEQHDEETVLMSRWVRALALTALGRCAEGWALLDSIAAVGKGEEVFWHARLPNTYGHILADLCLHDRALERDAESVEAARSSQARPVREAELQSLVNVAADRLALGDVGGARAAIELVRDQAADVEYARFRYLTRLHAVDAEVALADGEPERALAEADACLRLAAAHDQPKHEVRGHLMRGRAQAALGARAEGVAEIRAGARLADRLGFPGLSWRAWWAAHDLDGSPADLRRAQQAVRCAAAGAGALRDPFLAAVPVPP